MPEIVTCVCGRLFLAVLRTVLEAGNEMTALLSFYESQRFSFGLLGLFLRAM